MPLTYPPAATSLTGDVESINRYMNTPTAIARRLRTLAENRYIADRLLTGRYNVEGGAVVYETGESIFAADNPRAVAPGSEYPITSVSTGVASIAKTVNWGEDALVTDVAIKRLNIDPVNRAQTKLINTNVRYVDSVALSAIASGVTNGTAAQASWATATAKQILLDVALAKANILSLNQGYDPDTVVVDDINYAYAMAAFVSAGFFPREQNGANPALTGDFPMIDGLTWLATPNLPTAGQAVVLDSAMLGGMADENLGGPGYVNTGGVGIQVKSIRDEVKDLWRLRCRRVTVPVVVEPAAARKITGL